MKPFLAGIFLFIVLTLGILYTKPHTWFYHGMECTGGIGGGCDSSTATGGIQGWLNNE
tara:strand:+ start:226 stop:399 length:174 start_codon:yes stop_codon:yes gene_type:complete